uniref:Uncharacterized protein n=1 Tax=Magnetococcus massalia (strain MO-1) TaxID=451514 RepID=A0A1S7LI70_MAGMO|nr:Protein of unknown function [Candidatus Magnetococcus massalia]
MGTAEAANCNALVKKTNKYLSWYDKHCKIHKQGKLSSKKVRYNLNKSKKRLTESKTKLDWGSCKRQKRSYEKKLNYYIKCFSKSYAAKSSSSKKGDKCSKYENDLSTWLSWYNSNYKKHQNDPKEMKSWVSSMDRVLNDSKYKKCKSSKMRKHLKDYKGWRDWAYKQSKKAPAKAKKSTQQKPKKDVGSRQDQERHKHYMKNKSAIESMQKKKAERDARMEKKCSKSNLSRSEQRSCNRWEMRR